MELAQALALHPHSLNVVNHMLFYLRAASRASTGSTCVVGGWLLE